jgi:hypothetical protein
VLVSGRRFSYEGDGYYDYVPALLRAPPPGQRLRRGSSAGTRSRDDTVSGVIGGRYADGGVNLGPVMTFGYIAGSHVVGDSEHAMKPSHS